MSGAGGQTTLLSTGPTGGNGAFDASFTGASADGTRVFFGTEESLVSADTDAATTSTSSASWRRRTPPGRRSREHRWSVAAELLAGKLDQRPDQLRLPLEPRRHGDHRRHLLQLHPRRRRRRPDQITCTVTASNAGGSRAATSAPVTPAGSARGVRQRPDRRRRSATGSPASRLGDRLRGLGGNDVLAASPATTACPAAPATTPSPAAPGNDTLAGGARQRHAHGRPGTDRFAGGAGNDTINSRDQRRETVSCGTGRRDRVTADRVDRLVGCEIVRRG